MTHRAKKNGPTKVSSGAAIAKQSQGRQANEKAKLRQQPAPSAKTRTKTQAQPRHSDTTNDSRSVVARTVVANERERHRQEWLKAPYEATSITKMRRLSLIRRRHPGNSAQTQRERILMALAIVGTVTTHECRQLLDVMAVGVRIHELRQLGKNIVTTMVVQETLQGCRHRFARYVLVPATPAPMTAVAPGPVGTRQQVARPAAWAVG